MTVYGLTPNGFFAKPLSVVDDEIDAALRASVLGQSAADPVTGKLRLKSLAGQLKALMVDPIAAQWDLQQAVYASKDPEQATDAAQDVVCSITGTQRDQASFSTVPETVVGTAGTLLPAGRAVTVTGTNARFITQADCTIAAATAWSANGGLGTNYLKGDLRKNAGNVYLCITSGLGATGGLGPTGTGTDIVDGAAHWRFLGAGDGFVVVACQADTVGPIGALAGHLVTIATPVFGWTGAYNVVDATVGAFLESNTQLRIRREAELHSQGDAANDAIRARVLSVGQGSSKAVTTCSVFSNRTDLTSDGATPPNLPVGMPPHSVMVVADYDGVDDPTFDGRIGQAIWDAVGGGIATTFATGAPPYAMTTGVTDSQGNTQTVYWLRPEPVEITIDCTVVHDNTPGVFPSNGADLILGSILTYGADFESGRDVYASGISAAVFDGPSSTDPGSTPCPGILDVVTLVKVVPGGYGPSVSISLLQRGVFDSGRVTLHLSGAAP